MFICANELLLATLLLLEGDTRLERPKWARKLTNGVFRHHVRYRDRHLFFGFRGAFFIFLRRIGFFIAN